MTIATINIICTELHAVIAEKNPQHVVRIIMRSSNGKENYGSVNYIRESNNYVNCRQVTLREIYDTVDRLGEINTVEVFSMSGTSVKVTDAGYLRVSADGTIDSGKWSELYNYSADHKFDWCARKVLSETDF